MSAIEILVERLKEIPELSYRAKKDFVTVDSPSPAGFSVELIVGRSAVQGKTGFTVSFDGWHEKFAAEADALDCFAFGLSDACRLKVFRRCRVEYCWTMEYRDGEIWREDSTTGLLLFPFWCRREVLYRQNHVIRTADESAARLRAAWRKEPED